MVGFSDILRDPIRIYTINSKIMRFFIGALATGLMYLAITMFIPQDLSSTAAWYDSLGFQDAIDIAGTFPLFTRGIWGHIEDVSMTGGSISLLLSGFQVLMNYQTAEAGAWGTSRNGQHEYQSLFSLYLNRSNGIVLNHLKIIRAFGWLTLASIDTVTDSLYKIANGGGLIKFALAVLVSTLIFNIGSEIAITWGIRMIVGFVVYSQVGNDDIDTAITSDKKRRGEILPQLTVTPKERKSNRGGWRGSKNEGRGGGNQGSRSAPLPSSPAHTSAGRPPASDFQRTP